jgi:DNA-binding IclR family transcriptional regulator
MYSGESTESNRAPERQQNTNVQSIARAAVIMRCIMQGFHSIKDIAAQCDLSNSTVHRLLSSLNESGFVFKDPVNHQYYLGSLFNQLSLSQSEAHQQFLFQSIEESNRIWELFGEATILDVQVGLQKISLLTINSRYNYSYKNAQYKGPILYGSEAKVLLSQHSDEEIEKLLNSINLQPSSEYCVTDKADLKEQFQQARRQGYYISKEFGDGMMGISVPIKGYLFPAAISVAGPEKRLDPIALKIVAEIKISANRIADNIAGNT